ncbi:hypothetical protein BDN71DRAFT_1479683 [Pleurotus eryngii]|uniref:DUF659 domain-containing protein n=1 Tax=Pleurotus eryngii TaxID=5323 RepID=A0A9P6A6N5_PLEER|nr:hypothetical protein BDN71DRAFT_1479683 [Pleurotus eryngii]
MVQMKYPWILNMADPCHHISNLMKDICKIKHFQGVIKVIHCIVKFFKKSTIANFHLKNEQQRCHIFQGLVSIGKTRFGSTHHAMIQELCSSGLVKIPEVNNKFMPNLALTICFKMDLQQFLSITEPLVKSITYLESTHATPADVYLFWLAIMAHMNNILKSEIEVPNSVAEKIQHLCNNQFSQSINNGPSNIFVTAFFLNPQLLLMVLAHQGYQDANVLKGAKLNPLAVNSVRIARTSSGAH